MQQECQVADALPATVLPRENSAVQYAAAAFRWRWGEWVMCFWPVGRTFSWMWSVYRLCSDTANCSGDRITFYSRTVTPYVFLRYRTQMNTCMNSSAPQNSTKTECIKCHRGSFHLKDFCAQLKFVAQVFMFLWPPLRSPCLNLISFCAVCVEAAIEWFRDDISIALAPSTKSQWDFLIGFWIITKNNLCGKQKFMIRMTWTSPPLSVFLDNYCTGFL